MSLLLDALKRAEQEKLTRQGDRVPEPVPERVGANAASHGVPTLELQPIGSPPAAAPPRADAHAAQNVFQAKATGQPARNRGTLFAIAGAVAVIVLSAGGYVWYQVQALAPHTPPFPRLRPTPIAPPAADVNAPKPESLAVPPAAASVASSAEAPGAAPASAAPVPGAVTAPPDPKARLADALAQQPAAAPPLKLERKAEAPRIPPELNAGYDALVAGDIAAARRHYAAAIANDPFAADAQLGMATVEAREGNPAAAGARYRRVLELDPGNATALAGLAALSDLSRPEALETELRTQLMRHPESAALRMSLGNLYAAQGRWSEAQDAYFEAHRLEPGNADVLYNLAVSLDHLGQAKLAAEFYGRALAAARDRPTQFDPGPAARRLGELRR